MIIPTWISPNRVPGRSYPAVIVTLYQSIGLQKIKQIMEAMGRCNLFSQVPSGWAVLVLSQMHLSAGKDGIIQKQFRWWTYCLDQMRVWLESTYRTGEKMPSHDMWRLWSHGGSWEGYVCRKFIFWACWRGIKYPTNLCARKELWRWNTPEHWVSKLR